MDIEKIQKQLEELFPTMKVEHRFNLDYIQDEFMIGQKILIIFDEYEDWWLTDEKKRLVCLIADLQEKGWLTDFPYFQASKRSAFRYRLIPSDKEDVVYTKVPPPEGYLWDKTE